MPAVGSSRQSTLAPEAIRQASSTTRRVPVDSSLMKRSTKRAEPEEGDDLVGFGAGGPLPGSDAGHGQPDGLAHGQVLEQLGSLERAAESESGPPGGRQVAGVVAEDLDGAAAAHVAADGVHERRLAGTVGADEPDDLAGPDVQVDVDDDGATAVA